MEILFNEQDVVDSVCVYVAQLEHKQPDDIDVDLMFDQQIKASAVLNRFEQRYLEEEELIDAIAVFLRDYYAFDPNDLRIELHYSEEEGIGASILVG